MNKENKMYDYLLNHNYISENKKSNYQSELSIERAECIANKYNLLVEEENSNLKQALIDIREYVNSFNDKENSIRYIGTGEKLHNILQIIDKAIGSDNNGDISD